MWVFEKTLLAPIQKGTRLTGTVTFEFLLKYAFPEPVSELLPWYLIWMLRQLSLLWESKTFQR